MVNEKKIITYFHYSSFLLCYFLKTIKIKFIINNKTLKYTKILKFG